LLDEDLARELAGDDAAVLEQTLQRLCHRPQARTLAAGYYDRVEHLLNLQAATSVGIAVTLADVDDSEIHGLIAVRAAKVEFQRDHPACPYCGAARITPFDMKCRSCGERLRGTERES
jgi:tRNA(Ile2) C34 agmatinyltransferase TiaS